MARRRGKSKQQHNTTTTLTVDGGILQRQCATCGQHTLAGEVCPVCEQQQALSPNASAMAEGQSLVGRSTPAAGFSYDISRVPVRQRLPLIQAKLTVGQPGDKYEQEADRVAEQVMRMPAPEAMAGTTATDGQPLAIQRLQQMDKEKVQRQAMAENEEEEAEEKLKKEEEEEEEKTIQAKEQSGQVPTLTPGLEARLNTSKNGGQPLPGETQALMESQLCYDFSSVRVHADGEAAQLNQALNAQAFTHGQDVFFGAGKYSPESGEGKRLLAHELTHVVQQGHTNRWSFDGVFGDSTVSPVENSSNRIQRDATNQSITPEYARSLDDQALRREIEQLENMLSTRTENSEEYQTLTENLRILRNEREAPHRSVEAEEPTREFPYSTEEGAYPEDIALFSSYLIRGRYIQQVANVIPVTWRSMSEAELTVYLNRRYTEAQLREQFLARYQVRANIKARFRKYNIIAALVIGLIWARDNIAEGEWGTAAAKVGGSGVAAYAFNRLLYARDPNPTTIMRSKGNAFGRWFQGAARSNRVVNFLVRRVGGALLLWELKDIFMSGGYGGPNIPFDLITEIDIDDPSTWVEPSQTLLDMGFNIWYRQKCTPNQPAACGATPLYLGKVEGSAIRGILRFLDIAPHEAPRVRNNLYRLEGDWDVTDLFIVAIVHRRVSASENVLVIATGQRSGEMISGRGHYRSLQVRPANQVAVDLFGNRQSRFVPEYLLHPIDIDELISNQ